MSDSQVKSIFTSLFSHGGVLHPSNEWMDKVAKMYDMFNRHHCYHGAKVIFSNSYHFNVLSHGLLYTWTELLSNFFGDLPT